MLINILKALRHPTAEISVELCSARGASQTFSLTESLLASNASQCSGSVCSTNYILSNADLLQRSFFSWEKEETERDTNFLNLAREGRYEAVRKK